MLRHRVFLGGQAVSMVGNGLAALAVPLLVLQLTRSAMLAVLASLPASAGYLIAGLPAGVWTDRLGPWRVLAGADAVRAAAFLALFALTATRAAAAWQVLALAFAAGVAAVFFDTALAITVRDLFTGRRLVPANSWLESASQSGQVAGPGLAGLLAAAGLLPVAMLLNALTFLASLGSLAALRGHYRPADRPAPPARRGFRAELAAGFRFLAATRLLLTLLVTLLVLNLCLGADKLIVFFAKDALHLPAWQVGLVSAAGGAGGVLGALAAGRLCRRPGPVLAVPACAAGSGIALALFAVATRLPVLLLASLAYGCAVVAASVLLRALRQVLVPRELLGRVTAAWRLGGQAATVAGGLLAGAATSLLAGEAAVHQAGEPDRDLADDRARRLHFQDHAGAGRRLALTGWP